MSILISILEFWLGWQVLDAVRDYLRGVWHRWQLWRYENRPTMAQYIERKRANE